MESVGDTRPEEIIEVLETALGDPRFPKKPRFLLDVSESTSLTRQSSFQLISVAGILGARSERFLSDEETAVAWLEAEPRG
jgi:hypothetical protein